MALLITTNNQYSPTTDDSIVSELESAPIANDNYDNEITTESNLTVGDYQGTSQYTAINDFSLSLTTEWNICHLWKRNFYKLWR